MNRVLLLCFCLCLCSIILSPLPSASASRATQAAHRRIYSSRSHFSLLQAASSTAASSPTDDGSSTGGTGTSNGTESGGAGGDEPAAGSEEVLSSSDETTLKTGKFVLIPLVFLATIAASYLPWALKRFHHAMNWMAVGACFTAGIILGAALSHLLQEAGASFQEYDALHNPPVEGEEPEELYPFAPLIAGAVLLILVAIDFKMVRHGLLGDSHGHGHGHGGSGGHSHVIANLTEAPLNGQRKPQTKQAQDVTDVDRVVIHSNSLDDASPVPINKNDIPFDTYGSADTIVVTPSADPEKETSTSSDALPESEDIAKRGSKAQIARAWIFFVALSIHSIFDGLSVGAETSMSGFYALLAAVGGHKLLDGFALGVPIYFANFHPLHTAFSFIFCAGMTPLGIGIGMAATEGVGSESGTLSKAIILSMSAGSFLFISLVELLPAGFASSTWINLKLAAIFLGWGIMTMLAKWV